jgi:hypothetical protein
LDAVERRSARSRAPDLLHHNGCETDPSISSVLDRQRLTLASRRSLPSPELKRHPSSHGYLSRIRNAKGPDTKCKTMNKEN